VNLHPYDGQTRRFRDGDGEGLGRILVERLLRIPASSAIEGLRYDLSFYSGGLGILDHLAITVPIAHVELPAVLARARAETPERIVADASWCEYFLWLIDDEEQPSPLRDAAARFVNEHRADFQRECRADSAIWFESQSGVNSWVALWDSDGQLGYLAFDQG